MTGLAKGLLASIAAAGAGVVGPANACMPLPPILMLFENMSTTSAQMSMFEEGARAEVRKHAGLNQKCGSFVVTDKADAAEMKADGGLVAAKRAEIARQVLLAEGVAGERIKVEAGTDARAAIVAWQYAPTIQLRCDPASAVPVNSVSTCGGKYSRCYLELGDGTICEPKITPDMNRVTYSVDSNGERLN